MTVCFLCNEYPPGRHGGIGVFTRMMARALARAGHTPRVIGVCEPGSGLPERAEDGGVSVWRLPHGTGRFTWPGARYAVLRQALGWARRGEIDLVEVPDYEGWAAGWPRMAAPLLVRLHGSYTYFAAEAGRRVGGFMPWMEGSALRRADFLGSCSHYVARRTAELFQLPVDGIEVLHNPVEVPATPATAPRARHTVVFSGTLVRKKGIEALAAAWPLVKRQHPEAVLHVFGKDGRAEGGRSMQTTVMEGLNGLGGSLCFHGHVPRETVLAALAEARVAVFPSYAEAFALAPLEAMAQGCPTIYSRWGSGPELIRDGQDGLLVEPRKPEEIAAAISRLLADDELAARLGEAGRRRVLETFSCEVLVARNLAWYEACLKRFHNR